MFVLKTVFMCYVIVFFGKQQTVFGNFILDGNAADIKYFPYVGMIQTYCDRTKPKFFTCGATIINDKMFLTAAHCIVCPKKENKLKIIVYVGNTDYTAGTAVEISQYKAHPNFKPEKLIYDVALLYAFKNIPMSDNVQPVLLSNYYMNFKHAVIAGWGKLGNETENVPGTLMYLPVSFISRKECTNHGFDEIDEIIGIFCAGHLQRSRYVYGGEFGSGLVIKDSDTEYLVGVIVGIQEQYPSIAVYTNISYHYDWLNKTINKMLNQDQEKSHAKESKQHKCSKKKENIFDIFHENGFKKLLIKS